VTMLKNLTPLRVYRIALFVALVVVALGLPGNTSAYLLRVATTVIVYTCLAIGLNLILGYCGLVSFGHAAFFGVGAYTVGLLMLDRNWSYLPALGIGIVLSLIAGAIVGLTAWRVRGDYLALVTLGFASIATLVMDNWISLTRGPAGVAGIPLPTVFGHQLQPGRDIYFLCLVGMAIALAASALISRSYFGRALLTIKEDEIVARANGINVPAAKVAVFAIGAAIAGLAGALQAASLGYVGPASFNLDQSILMVEIVVVGGMASTWGPLIGSTILVAATEIFRFSPVWRPAVFGLVMIVILIVRADGVASILGLGRGSSGRTKAMTAGDSNVPFDSEVPGIDETERTSV
jgi:branched-chain amino acid transport system permease protein